MLSWVVNYRSHRPACPEPLRDLVEEPLGVATVDLFLSNIPTFNPSNLSTCFALSPFLSTAYALFSRLLHTTAPASLFFSATYKLFAVTTEVVCNGLLPKDQYDRENR